MEIYNQKYNQLVLQIDVNISKIGLSYMHVLTADLVEIKAIERNLFD